MFLFDDTVIGNIRVGRSDASDEECIAAARAACADEFIQRLPLGYQTWLGERGSRLSGGERQRLSIARAILRNAPILVLDEATAFADRANEAAPRSDSSMPANWQGPGQSISSTHRMTR